MAEAFRMAASRPSRVRLPMKVAFHFDEQTLGGGDKAIKAVLSTLRVSNPYAHSKVFTGTLLFSTAASRRATLGDVTFETVDDELYARLVHEWAYPQPLRWHALLGHARMTALNGNVFAVCLETADATTAAAIDRRMEDVFGAVYLGGAEVDESITSHLGAYRLCAFCRVVAGDAWLFWDGVSEDSKMHYCKDWLKDAGFADVQWESLNGRYTIFDRDHGAAQSYRAAHSRQWMRELFDSVADHAMPRLADGVPDIPEKLYAAMKAFRETTVDEQASHVALSCRRILDHTAEALFPPEPDNSARPDLGTGKYKNRLKEYLKQHRVSGTESDVIHAAMTAVEREISVLDNLSNKGAHRRIDSQQARRCLLRVLLLLDDLVSVRQESLPIRVRPDEELIRKVFGRKPQDPESD
ncbi:MAG: hypothetical protein ACOYMN_26120 [Roseimicrobium sp.]